MKMKKMRDKIRDNALDIKQVHWKKEIDRNGDTTKAF
jgi:hypothetical protein